MKRAIVTPATELPDTAVRFALAAFAGAVLLHVDSAPPWAPVAALVACAVRLAAQRGRLRLPRLWTLVFIVAALAGLTLLTFRTVNGVAAGSALLISMGAAKLLEMRRRRDALIVIASALFLLLAACLQTQSLLRLPFYAGHALLCCAALAAFAPTGRSAALSGKQAFALAGRALLFALPMTLLAFLFFPRLPGALWGLPDTGSATTGLGDEMSPGSISELTESDAAAFRVRFTGPRPRQQELYWRGPVLHRFDGYTWTRGFAESPRRPVLETSGPAYDYRIGLEPHGHNWWFTLDTMTGPLPPNTRLSSDFQLFGYRPVLQFTSYAATSHTSVRSNDPLSAYVRGVDLNGARGRNPRSVAFAQELRARSGSDARFAEAVVEHLRTGGFEYTLTPPRTNYDSVDELLFRTRQGFCGHYASAFAMLMRAGGVPARVVTGYLGGEWNPVGEYYIVRQSDAHAWTEIWLEGRGWTRVDPTAVVSPERLNRGVMDLLSVGSATARFMRSNSWLSQFSAVWDATENWWQERVVGFNLNAQMQLLDLFGIETPDARMLAWLLGGAAVLWLGWITWQLPRNPRGGGRDPLLQAWHRFERRLRRAGAARAAHEGPLTFGARAATVLPARAVQIQSLAAEYARLRYAPAGVAHAREVADFQRQVARLHVHPPHAAHALAPPLRALLHRRLPLYRRVPQPLRTQVESLTAQFLKRARFIGCNRLEVTADMRAIVGFQAALLLASRDLAPYRDLESVLLYPDEFMVRESTEDEAGVVTEEERPLSGQTIDVANIVLSWADVLDGIERQDGYNVVIHEFAHYLDHAADGVLSARAPGGATQRWHEILENEYAALCAAVDAGHDTLIDPYGAEDAAEFFAVASEVFFELPRELAAEHPELYAALRGIYLLDPAAWPVPVALSVAG